MFSRIIRKNTYKGDKWRNFAIFYDSLANFVWSENDIKKSPENP